MADTLSPIRTRRDRAQRACKPRPTIVEAALGAGQRHIGLEGLSIGALAEVTQDEQVRRVRAFRLARGTADFRDPRVPPPSSRPRCSIAAHARRRAACRGCARCSSNWMQARVGRAGLGLHLHQRRCRVRRPARPRARRAGHESVQAWQSALLRAVQHRAPRKGKLRADADERQMLFEIHGLILALHYEARFLRVPGAHGPRRNRLRATSRWRAAATPTDASGTQARAEPPPFTSSFF